MSPKKTEEDIVFTPGQYEIFDQTAVRRSDLLVLKCSTQPCLLIPIKTAKLYI